METENYETRSNVLINPNDTTLTTVQQTEQTEQTDRQTEQTEQTEQTAKPKKTKIKLTVKKSKKDEV